MAYTTLSEVRALENIECSVESIETSITTIASAVQALHIRQEAHEATDD